MKCIIKISVVLPVYNGILYLKESVQSVLHQSFNDFELIVCDDCSSDGSFEYLKSLNDPRIQLFRNDQNKGLFPTLNFLIKQCNADLIHLWAQDDVMYPYCLEECLKFHQKFPNVSFSFSRWHTIDEKGEITGRVFECEDHTISPEGHAISSILYGSIAGNIANVTLVKSDIEKAGFFNEKMKYCGDFEMWYKLTMTKHAGLSGKYLIKLRNHTGQLSKNLEASFFKLQENLQIYPLFLSMLPIAKQKYGKMALKWKIYPQYFNQFLLIIRKRKLRLAKSYLFVLKQYDNLLLLIIRWIIIKIFRILNFEQKFYTKTILSKL